MLLLLEDVLWHFTSIVALVCCDIYIDLRQDLFHDSLWIVSNPHSQLILFMKLVSTCLKLGVVIEGQLIQLGTTARIFLEA